MPPFNGRQIQQQLRAFLVFIQLQIIMYFLFLRRPQQPPPAPPPPPAIQRPRRRHNMWVRPWLIQREERGAFHNIMADLYATDLPGFTNYMRMYQYQGQHGGQQPGDDDDDDVPGDCGLIGSAAGGGQDRNPAREAKRQRDYLKDYFFLNFVLIGPARC